MKLDQIVAKHSVELEQVRDAAEKKAAKEREERAVKAVTETSQYLSECVMEQVRYIKSLDKQRRAAKKKIDALNLNNLKRLQKVDKWMYNHAVGVLRRGGVEV